MMRLAHCVEVGTLYDSLCLPKVIRNRWVSDFLGLMDTTIRPYATLLNAGRLTWYEENSVGPLDAVSYTLR